MAISAKMEAMIENASWVRRMFEEGNRLKARYGADKVYDFSLGNPVSEPPPQFRDALRRAVDDPRPGRHRYMNNAGFTSVRGAVAKALSAAHGLEVLAQDVIMTCGAAGGLNVCLKALLDPGDEVIVPSPYFVEYGFYCDNHGGRLVPVPTRKNFSLDLAGIRAALGARTKAVLINSPNNPTGQVYSERQLGGLAELLEAASKKYLRTIYLLSDEPYRKLVFAPTRVPSVFAHYPNSLIAYSWSKELCVPGERIGYVAVNPRCQEKELLAAALTLANRVLGFVNAPALMQRTVAALTSFRPDLRELRSGRDLLCGALAEAGYELIRPKGGFYVFPRSPLPDDVEFCRRLARSRILCVPGRAFGAPGHFRIAFCVERETIERALPQFAKAFKARG
jgi:aspartate aminotransferase